MPPVEESPKQEALPPSPKPPQPEPEQSPKDRIAAIAQAEAFLTNPKNIAAMRHSDSN